MAKLENWVFCPALSFYTMSKFCTKEKIGTHATNILIAAIGVAIAVAIAIFLGRFFIKEKGIQRGVYMYALAFANSGYVGDPLVKEIFGLEVLSYYKLYCESWANSWGEKFSKMKRVAK